MTTAMIIVPAGPPDAAARARDICWDWCAERGYRVDARVVPATRPGWEIAMGAWMTGEVQVLVVAERRHLPVDREPRVEVVSEERRRRRQPGYRPRPYPRPVGNGTWPDSPPEPGHDIVR